MILFLSNRLRYFMKEDLIIRKRDNVEIKIYSASPKLRLS